MALEKLIKSGFCFLKHDGAETAIYENKYTGLWLAYNYTNNTYKVLED